MGNTVLDTQECSGSGAAEFLFRLWHDQGRIQEFTVSLSTYLERFPDFHALLAACKDEGLCEAWPTSRCEVDRWGLPAKDKPVWEGYEIRLQPRGLLALRELAKENRLVHRQVSTVDGQRIDLRTMVGHVLATPDIANLADACRLWLTDLKYERSRARSKVRILLQRAIGIRGTELAAYDPHLKAEIMMVLASPGSFRATRKERESG